ncbi:hypothetical protein LDE05_16240 [Lactobacillus delbrueckii subsp. bulgaricus]
MTSGRGDYPNPDHVRQDIENGYAYLAKADDGENVGTLTIIPAPDHAYDQLDGHWQVDTNDYVTIHRVAIHSDHTGQRLCFSTLPGSDQLLHQWLQ